MCCHGKVSQIILKREQVINKKEGIEDIMLISFKEEKTEEHENNLNVFEGFFYRLMYLKDFPTEYLQINSMLLQDRSLTS